MDPQYSLVLLVSGVAAGLLWKQPSPESPAVTCHCECDKRGETATATGRGIGVLELGIICVLSFLLGALTVVLFVKGEVNKTKPSKLALERPAKGKGKKGVFGVASSVPISD